MKEKTRELLLLKERTNKLQESHMQFKGQIQALESVKELTVDLQRALSETQQKNKQLSKENKELAGLNKHAEYLLKEKLLMEEQQAKKIREIQMEFANLTGRYEETLKRQEVRFARWQSPLGRNYEAIARNL